MLLYNYINGDVEFEFQSVNMLWNREIFIALKSFGYWWLSFGDLVESHLSTFRFSFLTADKKVGFLYTGQNEKMKCVHRNNGKWSLCGLGSSFNVEGYIYKCNFKGAWEKTHCDNKTMTWLIWNSCSYVSKGRYIKKEASYINVLLIFFLTDLYLNIVFQYKTASETWLKWQKYCQCDWECSKIKCMLVMRCTSRCIWSVSDTPWSQPAKNDWGLNWSEEDEHFFKKHTCFEGIYLVKK